MRNQTNPANQTKATHPDQSKTDAGNGRNLFETITDKIISLIEAGEAHGRITWAGQGAVAGMPVNMKTGNAYSGINVLLLWAAAQDNGYTSPYWLTYKQAKDLGGMVRKGEKATTGIFWGSREIEEENDDGETATRKACFAKAFSVFNLDQIDGIERPDVMPAGEAWQVLDVAESLLQASGAAIIEGGTKAYYSPTLDEIHMPSRERFANAENFYAVALHELSHWTGHASRCARDLKNRFGDEAYAMEELIAELSAAFLSAETGIVGQLEGHASYIKSWLRVLKADPRAIVTAASRASESARYVLDAQASATARKAA